MVSTSFHVGSSAATSHKTFLMMATMERVADDNYNASGGDGNTKANRPVKVSSTASDPNLLIHL